MTAAYVLHPGFPPTPFEGQELANLLALMAMWEPHKLPLWRLAADCTARVCSMRAGASWPASPLPDTTRAVAMILNADAAGEAPAGPEAFPPAEALMREADDVIIIDTAAPGLAYERAVRSLRKPPRPGLLRLVAVIEAVGSHVEAWKAFVAQHRLEQPAGVGSTVVSMVRGHHRRQMQVVFRSSSNSACTPAPPSG